MSEKKVCTNCENKEHKEENSLAWEMLKELSRTVKRQTIIIFVVLALWFSTIAGFVWYLSMYDFTSEEIQVDSQQGDANYIGNDGDIYNGENSGKTQKTNP